MLELIKCFIIIYSGCYSWATTQRQILYIEVED